MPRKVTRERAKSLLRQLEAEREDEGGFAQPQARDVEMWMERTGYSRKTYFRLLAEVRAEAVASAERARRVVAVAKAREWAEAAGKKKR